MLTIKRTDIKAFAVLFMMPPSKIILYQVALARKRQKATSLKINTISCPAFTRQPSLFYACVLRFLYTTANATAALIAIRIPIEATDPGVINEATKLL